MSDIEKRARELLAAELDAISFPAMAAEIRDESGYNSCGAAMVRAVAAAIKPPEGYVLVPVEPTEAMERVAFAAAGYPTNWGGLREIWSAVLAARREVSP